MSEKIFFYGLFINRQNVISVLRGMKGREIGEAVLKDHRIAFYGHATPQPEEGKTVYGVLWEVETLAHFDAVEGFNEDAPTDGYYRREKVIVRGIDGKNHEAWIYVMNNHCRGEGETAYQSYLEGMIKEASTLGFPEEYVDDLLEYVALTETQIY